MALRKIHNVWYMYFRDENGRHRTLSLHVHDRDTAVSLERRYMEQLRAKKALQRIVRDFPEYSPPPPVQQTVPEVVTHQRGGIKLADMWECALKKRPLSRTHKGSWERFISWCPVKYADLVTPKLAQEYLEKHYGSGNGKSFNNNKTNLNTIFRCCLVEANLSASPFAAVINRRVTETETHRNLTADEFDRLLEVLPMDLKVLAMLSRWTCQRLETCARIVPEMFDFERLVFVIEPGKTRRFKKWVCVPIMPELEEFIRPLLPDCKAGKPIVDNFTTKKYKTEKTRNDKFSDRFRQICKSNGIVDTESGKASFHSIRGTAITWFKEQGIKGEELRSITGHTSDEVEDIYARDIASLSKIARKHRES